MVARLELEASQFRAGMEKAQRQVERFRKDTGSSLTKIQRQFSDFGKNVLRTFAFGSVTTAIYGLTRAVGSAIQAGDDLAKFAAKSGLAAEAASELAHAAKMADLDLSSLATGIKKMQVSISQLGSGSKTAKQTFDALGISLADIQRLSPDKQFELIAEKISQLKDPADRTRAAVELFGKAGADLLPLFEEGAEGIRKAREEAEKLGKSFSAEDLKKFQEADDAFKRLKASGSSLADVLAIRLTPAIVGISDNLSKLISGDVDKSWLFALLAAPPNVNLLNFIRQLTAANKELLAVSSGPTGRKLPGLEAAVTPPPGFAGADAAAKAAEAAAKAAEEHAKWRAEIQGIIEAEKYLNSLTSNSPWFMDYREANTLIQETGANIQALAEKNQVVFDQMYDGVRLSFEESTSEMTLFADQAARNLQSAFADFLFDPFSEGLDGMLKGFIDVIRRMIAEAAAAKILEAFGGSGIFGSILGGLFGGATGSASGSIPGLASGGPVSSGRAYMVGEQGPELFVPGASGNIVPNGAMGGVTVAPVYNIDNRGATVEAMRALPAILNQNNAMLEGRIVEGIRRNRYRLNPV